MKYKLKLSARHTSNAVYTVKISMTSYYLSRAACSHVPIPEQQNGVEMVVKFIGTAESVAGEGS